MIDYLIRLYLRRKIYKELCKVMSRDLFYRGGIPAKTNYQLTYPETMEIYRDKMYIKISRESSLHNAPVNMRRSNYDELGYPEVPELLNVGAKRLALKLYNKVVSNDNIGQTVYVDDSKFVYRFNHLGIDILEIEVDSNRDIPKNIISQAPFLIIAGVLNV